LPHNNQGFADLNFLCNIVMSEMAQYANLEGANLGGATGIDKK
jgi:hypothetical protein